MQVYNERKRDNDNWMMRWSQQLGTYMNCPVM